MKKMEKNFLDLLQVDLASLASGARFFNLYKSDEGLF